MNRCYRANNNAFAKKVIHEYKEFMKETQKSIDEIRKATMMSLKKLLKLKDGDIIEISDDDTLKIISTGDLGDDRE
jgi:flagellar motor switch protein FliM